MYCENPFLNSILWYKGKKSGKIGKMDRGKYML